ncbi:hypothetical protein [Streptobacillus ratti]|uniref:hypothetical protein n=1 Tax=Streptobacillus ratti TaxID=1720557 RepID=UPI00093360CE|nr:hypothetical protein [Streptobacillus ratti]
MRFIDKFKDILVEIYDDDILSIGYIIAEDEENIVVREIDPLGFESGITVSLKKSINKIQKNTKYLKELEILIKENSKENILNSYIFKKNDFKIEANDNILDSTLHEIMNKNTICSITNIFDDEITFGFISKIEDEYIVLVYQNETIVMRKDDIKSVEIEDISLKRDYLIDTKN